MTNIPIPQQIYRHFKGNLYQIVSLAEHTETGEKLVIYQALYGEFKVYARPLSQFLEKVDHTKYPDVLQKYRFEQVTVTDDEEGQDEQDCADSIENDPQMEETSETNLEAACQDIQQDNAGTEETLNIDPLVLEFLDAKSYEDRLNILASLHHRITDDMINIMAMSMDVEVKEGDIEDRYTELRKCLLLYDKFECTRLR